PITPCLFTALFAHSKSLKGRVVNARYQAKMRTITDRIHELRLLRDAQTPESRNHFHFQEEIDRLTVELLGWEDNAGRLAELDIVVRDATRRLTQSQQRAGTAATGWTRLAGVTGALGALLLVDTLLWQQPTWMPITAVTLFVVAVAALQRGVEALRHAVADIDTARAELAEAINGRASALPTGGRR
ncbi:MAG: hypothetical protein ACRDUA_14385, partial [Micromonosporaceae bacterium]